MYTVYFKDNTTFRGGSLYNTRWKDIPKKPIKRIDFHFGSVTHSLRDCIRYNHLVEATLNRTISGKFINVTEARWAFGLFPDGRVKYIRYDLKSKKCDIGITTLGKEFRGQPTSGWIG